MAAPVPLKHLRSAKTGKGLQKLIVNLKLNRRKNKIKALRKTLTPKQRLAVLEKTDRRCHICGIDLIGNDFQADHVKAHSSGGTHTENNYLPSCFTCNNYRWHYSPEEIQLILKLGVWIKTKIVNDKDGIELANAFIKKEMQLRKRRKQL
ncbi:MAG: HNH endonuclease signature motif containing protein [Flavihumibacter sp.]|nr:HNH endonuclease signature motif containing protein [Flavihumibacter sp.]